MKKTLILSILCIAIAVGCKSKKNTTVTPGANTEAAELAAAKTRIPSTTEADMKKGHEIYTTSCARCHGAKNITNHSEQEWTGILDRMAPKAKLTAEEKDAVWKYILGVRLSSK